MAGCWLARSGSLASSIVWETRRSAKDDSSPPRQSRPRQLFDSPAATEVAVNHPAAGGKDLDAAHYPALYLRVAEYSHQRQWPIT